MTVMQQLFFKNGLQHGMGCRKSPHLRHCHRVVIGTGLMRVSIKNTLKFTAITCFLGNLPLIIITAVHWPNYDQTFIRIMGSFPGQYLFLFLFFPFIAFWTHLVKQDLIDYTKNHTKDLGHHTNVLWKMIVYRRWGVPVFGISFGLLLAVADQLATSRGLDELPPNESRLGLISSDTILRAVKSSNSYTLVKDLQTGKRLYREIHFNTENLRSIAKEEDVQSEKNRRIIEKVAAAVSDVMRKNPSLTDSFKEKSKVKLDQLQEQSKVDKQLLPAIVYVQTVLDPRFNPRGRVESALDIANFIELVAVVFVATHVAFYAWLLIYMRIRVFKLRDLPPQLVRAAASLVWVTVLFGLWPAFRIYTINESNIVFPQGATLKAPLFVYVFCFIVILFLVGAFLRKSWLEIGSVVVGVVVSAISFVVGMKDTFLMRDIIGSSISIGNLIVVILASLAVLIFVGSLLFPEHSNETIP